MKDEVVLAQFEFGRNGILKEAAEVTEEIADIVPTGLSNSLRWQMGHVLLSTEQLLFYFSGESMEVEEGYNELFASGTRPADWNKDAPSVEQLHTQLTEQMTRIRSTFEGRLDEEIEKPFKAGTLELHTIGELLLFVLFHESEHRGIMKVMKEELHS